MIHAAVFSVLLGTIGQLGEIHQDFHGGAGLHPGLRVFGPNAEQVVRHERTGLRIALANGRPDISPVGIETLFAISGDFEITLTYEILSGEQPEKGMGAGVKVWAKSASQEFQALTLAHVINTEGASVVVPIRAITQDGEKLFESEPCVVPTKNGRLRIARTGADVSFSYAALDSDAFEEFQRATMGTDDLGTVRVSAGTANDSCGLAVRFHDLRICAASLPAASAPIEQPSRCGIWLLAVLVVAAGGTGSWIWWKHRS